MDEVKELLAAYAAGREYLISVPTCHTCTWVEGDVEALFPGAVRRALTHDPDLFTRAMEKNR